MSVVNLKVLRITYTEQNLALICHYFNSNSSWQVNSLNDAKVVCCPKDERMDRSRKKNNLSWPWRHARNRFRNKKLIHNNKTWFESDYFCCLLLFCSLWRFTKFELRKVAHRKVLWHFLLFWTEKIFIKKG